jgi:hypothetical protein
MNESKKSSSRRKFLQGVTTGAAGFAAAGLLGSSKLAVADVTPPKKTSAEKLTVLNPLGVPPAVKLIPQAKRLDTLDGKTIYLVNDGYIGTEILLPVVKEWFDTHYPKTTVVIKRKGGMGFAAEDPALFDEINQKGDAMVIGLGH